MENIFSTIDPTDFFTTTNGVISSLSPVIVLLLGILLAMFILDAIINIFRKPSQEKNDEEYIETADDFPY